MNTLLGQRIREQRKEKGWTIEQFAERVELSANYVGDLERGVKIPKLETFIRIVEVLDVSADVLILDSVASASHVADDELCKKLSPYWQNTLRYITFPPFRGIRTHSDPSLSCSSLRSGRRTVYSSDPRMHPMPAKSHGPEVMAQVSAAQPA